ncbi:MAG TPA: hypothetical protein DCM64_05190 [Gammaproteobacteria bacterium]|nr:hypothetical protein [Gammaproteobacteria bacterium]
MPATICSARSPDTTSVSTPLARVKPVLDALDQVPVSCGRLESCAWLDIEDSDNSKPVNAVAMTILFLDDMACTLIYCGNS